MIRQKIIPALYNNIIAIGFSFVIIIMGITSHFASSQMTKSADAIAISNKQHDTINKLLADMTHAILSRSLILKKVVESDDPFERDELFQELNSYAAKYSQDRNLFKIKIQDEELSVLLEQQWQLARKNYPLQNQIYDFMMEENNKAAEEVLNKRTENQNSVLYLQSKMALRLYKLSKDKYEISQKDNEQILSFIKKLDYLSIFISLLLASFILSNKNKSDTKLKTQARTDTLTKLPNRTEFSSKISAHIQSKPSSTFAVLFLDIDDFKSINDNFGHETGDKVLQRISNIISSSITPIDVLSRFGGDEFVLLLRSIESKNEADEVVSRISRALDTSFTINESKIFISSSIGVSLYSQDADNPSSLLKYADIAMYTAKESGKNGYSFYSKETSRKIEKDHQISHRLRNILNTGNSTHELYLMFQPLLNIETGDVSECEALIRWKDTEGNNISPSEFIPLAEKSNLIEKINRFVINESCRQQLRWKKDRSKRLRININLSGNKLVFSKALKQLKSNIKKFNLDPSLFGIELTERTIFEISEESINELKAVRDQGMKISIDDFGTGYSSLSYLRKLPLTTLKIDKEFINNLSTDFESRTLVRMIISLGQSLKLEVVAEGVETYEQFKFLEDNFCHTAQGFYLHKPLDQKEISNLKYVA